jgi:hypothetical protein
MPEQTFPVNSDDVLEVDASRYPVPVLSAPASSAVVSSATASGGTSTTKLLSANTARKGALFFNFSMQTMLLRLGGDLIGPGDYSLKVGPESYYALPPFTGEVWALWETATPSGGVQITELS